MVCLLPEGPFANCSKTGRKLFFLLAYLFLQAKEDAGYILEKAALLPIAS